MWEGKLPPDRSGACLLSFNLYPPSISSVTSGLSADPDLMCWELAFASVPTAAVNSGREDAYQTYAAPFST